MLAENPSSLSAKSPAKSFNVFAMPAGFSGCAWWRYRLPLAKLQKKGSGLLNLLVANNPGKGLSREEVDRCADLAHVVSLQSPGGRDSTLLMRLYKQQGKKVVIDYDDYSFDLSPGNPRYAQLGTREAVVYDKDGKEAYRWRDGENGFDLKANIEKYNAFVEAVKEADLVTTTTEYLASKFRPLNSKVAICPNSVDFDLWKPIPRPDEYRDQVRIGWFGGDSHFEDLKMFKDLLPRICRKYPKAKIVLQCPGVPEWREIFSDIPQNQLEWHLWAPLNFYTLFLASRHWDIGLCPLDESMEFNKCKSNIKCLEFAALKVPVVAQRMIPYSNHLVEGKTGLLASTVDEWESQISRLIESETLRKEIASNAYQDAYENHNLDKNCLAWERAYLGVLGQ